MLAWAMPSVSRLTIGQFYIQPSQRSENHSTFNTQHSTLKFNIQHSTFNIKNSTFNTQQSTLLKRMKKNFWEVVIRIAIAALTAALTALGTTSCMGYGPF
jgi:hypothetical protein